MIFIYSFIFNNVTMIMPVSQDEKGEDYKPRYQPLIVKYDRCSLIIYHISS